MKTCAHLSPIEEALAARRIALAPIDSPYGGDANVWLACECTFDEPALRARLRLDPRVTYVEYDGRAAGSDATFTCPDHRIVILGLHPGYAPKNTPRLA